MLTRREFSGGLLASYSQARSASVHFPGAQWEQREPREAGLDASRLDQLAAELEGHGCVVKDGFVVKTWGNQSEKRDWLSSVKPLFSTLLFFAIQEKKL